MVMIVQSQGALVYISLPPRLVFVPATLCVVITPKYSMLKYAILPKFTFFAKVIEIAIALKNLG